MSRKSVLFSRLACGLVFLFGAFCALDAWAALSFSPPQVTGTIHYSPASPTLSITSPTATTVNTANQTLVGSLSTAGNLNINGVNVPLSPSHGFSYPVTLNPGVNTFILLGVDLGGNRTTLIKSIVLDTTAPSVPDTSFISASLVGPDGKTTITGTPGAVAPNTLITITDLKSGAYITFTSDATGAFPPGEELAAHSSDVLKITSADAAGNTSFLIIQVPGPDTTPPVVTFTPQPPPITYTTTDTYTFTGTVSEPVSLYLDNAVVVPVNPDLTFSYTVTLQPGNNEFSFLAVDNAGNENTNDGFVNIFLDTAPVITVTSNPNTGLPNFMVTGKVSGLLFDINSTITVNGVSTPVVWSQASQTDSFSIMVPLVPGKNDIVVSATDEQGVSTTITTSVYLNTGAPTITITSPTPSYTNKPEYDLTGQLIKEPAQGGLTVTVDGQSNPVTLNPDLSFSSTVEFTQEGPHTIVIQETDQSGQQASQTLTMTTDFTPPTITLTTDTDGDTNQSSITLTGSLSEAVSQFTVNIRINDQWVQTQVPVGPGPDFSFSTTLSIAAGSLVNGYNFIELDATDLAGNPAPSIFWSVTLDTAPPIINVPLISAADVLDGNGNPTGQATFSGLAGAIDNSPGNDNDVTLTLSGVASGASVTANVQGDGDFDTTLLASAEDPFNIIAVDGAGNVSSTRVQLGTACYVDGFVTRNAMLSVSAGSGTVIGPQGSTAVFHVTRTGELGYDTYVDYQTADGDAEDDTAVAGQDYTSEAGSVKIPAGASSADITIPLLGGSANGPDKTFTLQIMGTHNPIMGATGNGGGFAVRDHHPVGNSPWFAAIADINGDGKPDVITANNADAAGDNTSDGTVSVLLNTTPDGAAQESLADQQSITAGLGTSSVAVADVNGDGKPDLVVTNQVDDTVMVFLNTTPMGSSTVSFTAPLILQLPTGSSPESVAVADLNGDGKPDVVVGNDQPGGSSNSSVMVYLNTTDAGATAASFAAPQTFVAGTGAKWNVVIADVNSDGLPDIITANDGMAGDGSDSSVSVLLNTTAVGASTPTFVPEQQYPVAGYVSSVVVADLNGDGIPDLAATSENQNAVVVMTNQTATGTMTLSFAPAQTLAVGSSTDSVAAADLDGDGKIDLIVANNVPNAVTGTGGNTVSVLHNKTAAGATAPSFSAPIIYGTGYAPWPVLVADLNKDGKPDIITVDENDNTVSVLMNHIGDAGYVDYGSCVMPDSVIGTVHYGIVAPVITITSPAGTSFESPYQVLSGSVSGPATLSVNGVNVPLNADGTFSMNITLQMGDNTYQLTATSAIGVPATQTLTLTLNSPSLPAPGASGGVQFTGGSGQVTITGTAPAGATGVTVLDITTGSSRSGSVGVGGSYSVTVMNASLSDSFSVTFTGSGGAQSAPVYVQGNDPALSLNVTAPCSGTACNSPITIDGDTVSIAGSFSGPVDTGITVNGGVAHFANGSFYVNNLPLTPGNNTITVTATAPSGLSTTQVLTINSTGITTLVLKATPSDMVTAPFTVEFSYSFQGTATIAEVKMSFLGNGINDVDTDNPADATLIYTYITPGVYPATLTLVDTDGVQYQAQVQVVVQDPSWADAAISAAWKNFTGGLGKLNRGAAMNSLDFEAQQKYAPIIDTLLDQMPQIVGSFSDLFHGASSGDRVERTVVRVVNGQAQVFFVYFILDNDGVWRIDAM